MGYPKKTIGDRQIYSLVIPPWPHGHDTFSSAWTRFQASARLTRLTTRVFLSLLGKTQPRFLLESSCRTNWPFDIFRLLWLPGQTHRKLCFKVYFNSLTVFWRKFHHLWNRTLHILHPSSMFFPGKLWKKPPFLAVERVRRPYHEEDLLLLGSFHQHLRVVDPGFTPGLPKN